MGKKKKTGSQKKTSVYRGVALDKRNGDKWVAYVWYDRSRIYVGYFDDEVTAAQAVNYKCIELKIPQYNPQVSAVEPDLNRIRRGKKSRGQSRRKRKQRASKKRKIKIESEDKFLPARKIRKIAKEANSASSSKVNKSKVEQEAQIVVKTEYGQVNRVVKLEKIPEEHGECQMLSQDEDFIPESDEPAQQFSKDFGRTYKTRSLTRRIKAILPETVNQENVVRYDSTPPKLEKEDVENRFERVMRIVEEENEDDEYEAEEEEEEEEEEGEEMEEEDDEEDRTYDPSHELEEMEEDDDVEFMTPMPHKMKKHIKKEKLKPKMKKQQPAAALTAHTKIEEPAKQPRAPLKIKVEKNKNNISKNKKNNNNKNKKKISKKLKKKKVKTEQGPKPILLTLKRRGKRKNKSKKKIKVKQERIQYESGKYYANQPDEEEGEEEEEDQNNSSMKVQRAVQPRNHDMTPISQTEPEPEPTVSEPEPIVSEPEPTVSEDDHNSSAESSSSSVEMEDKHDSDSSSTSVLKKLNLDDGTPICSNWQDSNNFEDSSEVGSDLHHLYNYHNKTTSHEDDFFPSRFCIMTSDEECDNEYGYLTNNSIGDERQHSLEAITMTNAPINSIPSPSTPQYEGVVWDNMQQRWKASIFVDGQSLVVGHYDHEVWAAQVVNGWCKEFCIPLMNPDLPCILPDERTRSITLLEGKESDIIETEDLLASESEPENLLA